MFFFFFFPKTNHAFHMNSIELSLHNVISMFLARTGEGCLDPADCLLWVYFQLWLRFESGLWPRVRMQQCVHIRVSSTAVQTPSQGYRLHFGSACEPDITKLRCYLVSGWKNETLQHSAVTAGLSAYQLSVREISSKDHKLKPSCSRNMERSKEGGK